MGVIEGTQTLKTFSGEYDFAVDGGVIGTIPLRATPGSQGDLPVGAIIEAGFLEVDTALVGAGASVGVQAEGAGDVVGVAVISGAPWSTTGRKSIIPVATGATTVKTTARRSPAMVISGANLTAGKFRVVLHYR